ncbi:MAG: hypothetical protein A3F43_05645 [Gammaproteobacteria bacterium RIFCSPHIGHO2_12_FULL_42_10]|nr:MAG: hypothetical protein A3F43_05645 [Gammaproteobacteria bacterium RIFCSPHIGHO2_12_FULL_42_10]
MSLFKTLTISFVTTIICLPLCTVEAGDLTIINNTGHDSTSVINNGPCSANILGDVGITHAHTTNVVPETTVIKACIFNKSNCTAAVHMTNNCSGPVVATVVLDVKKGIKEIRSSSTSEGYVMSGSNFTATLEGGPTHQTWLQYFAN